jgi:hypothetical protein
LKYFASTSYRSPSFTTHSAVKAIEQVAVRAANLKLMPSVAISDTDKHYIGWTPSTLPMKGQKPLSIAPVTKDAFNHHEPIASDPARTRPHFVHEQELS